MICLLCQESNKDSIKLTNYISSLLFKYFRFCFDTEPIDGNLCKKCWLSLVSFHDFYVRIETAYKKINKNSITVTLNETIIKEENVDEDVMDYEIISEYDNSQSSFISETIICENFTSENSQAHVTEREHDDQTDELAAKYQQANPTSLKNQRYVLAYDGFVKWQKKFNQTVSFGEPSLLAYFGEIAETFKPSTLWSLFSMLKSTILSNQNINISEYSQLLAFLKRKGDGFHSKKTKLFTVEETKRFLVEAPDGQYLAMKVVLLLAAVGASRGENVKTSDIQDNKKEIVIRIWQSKTTNSKTYTIDGQFAEIVRTYMKLRPEHSPTDKFFMRYVDGKCTLQIIGKNTMASIPKEIAKYLQLPDWQDYTKYSFRRFDDLTFLSSEMSVAVTDKTINGSLITIDETGSESSDSETYDFYDKYHDNIEDPLENKSQKKYMNAYDAFTKWQKSKGTVSFAEPILLDYFNELSNSFKPSTLWSVFSMLKNTLLANQNINMSEYCLLTDFLKKKAVGFQSKKTKIFTTEEVRKFMVEAPDNDYLAMKTVLVLGITGTWTLQEMINFKINDIQDNIKKIIIRAPKKHISKTYTIDGQFVEIMRKYMKLRPEKSTTDRFFLQYRNSKCTSQVIGKPSMASIPKEIAKYLQLPDWQEYTGYSFRRFNEKSYKFLTDSGAAIETKQRHVQKRKIENVIEPSNINSFKKKANATITTTELPSETDLASMNNASILPQHYENVSEVKEEIIDESFTIIKEETVDESFATIDESLKATAVSMSHKISTRRKSVNSVNF